MTPKEKAEELFNDMSNYTDGYAKQCALKVVDEIISALNEYADDAALSMYDPYGLPDINSVIDWQEVRNEIENI